MKFPQAFCKIRGDFLKKKHTVFPIAVTILFCLLVGGLSIAIGGTNEKPKRRNRVNDLFFTPRSSQIVGSCSVGVWESIKEGSIRFWSIEDGRLVDVVTTKKEPRDEFEVAYNIAVSHNGNLLAVAFYTERIGLYSIKEKRLLWKSKWLKKDSLSPLEQDIAFTQDDTKVIVAGAKSTVIYGARTGDILEKQKKPLSKYPYYYHGNRGNVLSPSGRYLVAWNERPIEGHNVLFRFFLNKWVTIWDIEENKQVDRWKKAERDVVSAIFTPEEDYILFGFEDGYMGVWSVSEQKMIRDWNVDAMRKPIARPITFSQDGQLLAIFGYYNGFDVTIWDYPSGKLIHNFGKDESVAPSDAMAFSPDGKYFALEQNGYLCLYDTKTWEKQWCVPSCPQEQHKKSKIIRKQKGGSP